MSALQQSQVPVEVDGTHPQVVESALRSTLECLEQLYLETDIHPANLEWDASGVRAPLPLDLLRDAPYFTREIRRNVPAIFQGAMYAALGMAGAKAIESVAYGSQKTRSSTTRKLIKSDVDAATYLCLSERYGDRQLENVANFLWLHLVRVIYAEMPLSEVVRLAR